MPRTCKVCKTKFEPTYNSVQVTCSYQCAIKYAQKQREKKEKKEWNKRKKQMSVKAKYRTHKKALQDNVNKLARMIDAKFKMKTCICCTLPLDKRTAGAHFHSVGSNETIRFNLHNIHTSTFHCNSHKATHHTDYKEGLVKRYGQEYYDYVEYTLQKHPLIKLTEKQIYDKKLLTAKLIRDFDTFEFTNPILARDQLNQIIGIYEPRT